MGAGMNLAAALFIVFSKNSGGLTVKGGVAGLVLTYTQQVTLFWVLIAGTRVSYIRYHRKIALPPLPYCSWICYIVAVVGSTVKVDNSTYRHSSCSSRSSMALSLLQKKVV